MGMTFNPTTGNLDIKGSGGASTGATTALDNLASVAINTSLISDTDSTDDLGSSAKYWANAYTDKIYLNGTAALDGTAAGEITVTGKITTTSNIKSMPQHLRFTLVDPKAAYGKDHEFCIWNKVDAAITVTNLEVTCDADPTTEPTGDIKYADAFIGLGSPTVINDFDTTNGVRSDSSITSGAVAAGKCIYISFDAEPDAALTQISFDITYDYD